MAILREKESNEKSSLMKCTFSDIKNDCIYYTWNWSYRNIFINGSIQDKELKINNVNFLVHNVNGEEIDNKTLANLIFHSFGIIYKHLKYTLKFIDLRRYRHLAINVLDSFNPLYISEDIINKKLKFSFKDISKTSILFSAWIRKKNSFCFLKSCTIITSNGNVFIFRGLLISYSYHGMMKLSLYVSDNGFLIGMKSLKNTSNAKNQIDRVSCEVISSIKEIKPYLQ